MQKWIEVSGKNEAAAIASALSQLGLERDDVSVEVLERAKSGFLGFGSCPARVRVSYEAPDEIFVRHTTAKAAPVAPEAPKATPIAPEAPKVASAAPVKPAPAAAPAAVATAATAVAEPVVVHEGDFVAAPARAQGSHATPSRDNAPFDPAIAAQIADFLTGLMKHMKVDATPNVTARSSGGYHVVLDGEHLGVLIGHRGETLDSIQQLCNYSLNRGRSGTRVRVHLDVEGYRQKREEALRRLAEKVALKVVKYRRNVTLEPMNAYERHIIHETLQGKRDITTYSMGTEPHRRTVVAYARGKQNR